MRSLRVAWSFLTRLPGGTHPRRDDELPRSVPWFPVVGFGLGGLLGLGYLGLVEVFSAPIAALLVVGIGAAVTGGFHEDGLADTFDALGGFTPERRLEIMRDSRIGTFGTLALVTGTGLKVVALASLDGPDGLAALVLAHGLGRAAALAVMVAGPEARTDGLAASAADLPRGAVVTVVVLSTIGGLAVGPPTAVVAGILVLSLPVVVTSARALFGGTSGDVLGATEQLGEIVVLLVASAMVVETGWLWS